MEFLILISQNVAVFGIQVEATYMGKCAMGFNGWQNHGHKGLEIKAVHNNFILICWFCKAQLTGKIKVREVMGNIVVHKA